MSNGMVWLDKEKLWTRPGEGEGGCEAGQGRGGGVTLSRAICGQVQVKQAGVACIGGRGDALEDHWMGIGASKPHGPDTDWRGIAVANIEEGEDKTQRGLPRLIGESRASIRTLPSLWETSGILSPPKRSQPCLPGYQDAGRV
jgi:hypothetical protein